MRTEAHFDGRVRLDGRRRLQALLQLPVHLGERAPALRQVLADPRCSRLIAILSHGHQTAGKYFGVAALPLGIRSIVADAQHVDGELPVDQLLHGRRRRRCAL